jgi:hypothetical protein
MAFIGSSHSWRKHDHLVGNGKGVGKILVEPAECKPTDGEFGQDIAFGTVPKSRHVRPSSARSRDALLRNATTGIGTCCARAAMGHAAAPPSSVMNSRRLIQ